MSINVGFISPRKNITNINCKTGKKISFKGDNKIAGDYVDLYNNLAVTPGKIALGIFSLSTMVAVASFALKNIAKKFNKNISTPVALVTGALLTLASAVSITLIQKSSNTKPITKEKQIQKEKEIRQFVDDTCAKKGLKTKIFFVDFKNTILSNNIQAFCFPHNGYIALDKSVIETSLKMPAIKATIVHELKHLEQYSNMVRLNLFDFNKAMIKKLTANDDKEHKNWLKTASFDDIEKRERQNIKNNHEEYLIFDQKDVESQIKAYQGEKLFVENPDISADKLPMSIGTEFYGEILKNKAALTEEEAKKARKQLKYFIESDLNVTKIGMSEEHTKKYSESPLEIEAYDAEKEFIKTGKII